MFVSAEVTRVCFEALLCSVFEIVHSSISQNLAVILDLLVKRDLSNLLWLEQMFADAFCLVLRSKYFFADTRNWKQKLCLLRLARVIIAQLQAMSGRPRVKGVNSVCLVSPLASDEVSTMYTAGSGVPGNYARVVHIGNKHPQL